MKSPIKKPSGEEGLVTTTDNSQFRTDFKQAIAGLALRGLIDYDTADWLIQEGGLAHD